jgi:hypothetical protein
MPKRRQMVAVVTMLIALFGSLNSMRPSRAATKRSTVQATNTSGESNQSNGSNGSKSTRAVPSGNRSNDSNRSDPRLRRIGFRSPTKLHQHFQKHGREFGNITEEQYLAMAQDLRDAPLSKTVIEAEQVGGTVSRFDRSTGGFTAFDRDLTIRTFFRPDDGEAYFKRAAQRSH